MKKLIKKAALVLAAGALSACILTGTAEARGGEWLKKGDKWMYSDWNGNMLNNQWEKIDKNWYHFNNKGYMDTGWQKISGKWYYFGSKGIMRTGWQKISGNWYYFGTAGSMKTGWQRISGDWYYFGKNGIMRTGWVKISNAWYYFQKSGEMVTGSRVISGKKYTFDADGKWIKDVSPDNIEEDCLIFSGHRYKVFNIGNGHTWEEARDFCIAQGGHLATITSKNEQNVILAYLQESIPEVDVWIGLTDKDSEGDWSRWVTGEKVTYTNWADGQPDNYNGDNYDNQDYAVISNGIRSGRNYYIAAGEWDDIDYLSNTNLGYLLCEWDK